jgi:hypothetical protein
MTHPPHSTESADPLGWSTFRSAADARVAAIIEALGPQDPRAWREELARISAEASARIAEARAVLGRSKPARKPRKPRRPPLDSLLKQAAKAGKSVKGAEVHQDRTVLQFGEPEPVEPDNPWPLDEFQRKETKQ